MYKLTDCTGREASVGDLFTYPARRSSQLFVNRYKIDEINEAGIVKATIVGGPDFRWRAKKYDAEADSFTSVTPRQSTLSCFDQRATIFKEVL